MSCTNQNEAYNETLLEEINRLKKRVAELETRQQSLLETETMHTQLLDAIKDMVLCKDEQFRIVYANRAFREFYGMSLEELQGMIDAPFNPVENTTKYLEDDARVFETRATVDIAEEPVTRHDGRVFLFNTLKSPLFDTKGKVKLMVAVCRDITERKEIDRRVSEFHSMVSHELRTPLTSIRAALGLIEGGHAGEIEDSTMELINIARNEAERLIRLINDILDIKRIEADKLELRLEPVQAIEVLDLVLNANRGLAQEKGLRLLATATESCVINADRDRTVQVLTNLVANAIKFSPKNCTIQLRVEKSTGGVVRFSVSDEGPGIPQEQQDKLFRPFQQIDSSDSRSQGGSGLGLAISKAIVERHGGRIGLNSSANSGSTFWFEIPAL